MKNYYIAVQIKENDKLYAYVIKVSKSDNLLSKLDIKDILTANICQSKKEAELIVNSWNTIHKDNGRYLFDLTY